MLEGPYLCWPFSYKESKEANFDRYNHFVTHLSQLQNAVHGDTIVLKAYKIFKAPLNPQLFKKLLDILSLSEITRLDISDNLLLPDHHQQLIEFVENHKVLEIIDISYTGLNAQSMQHWARHLEKDTALKCIRLKSSTSQSEASLELVRRAVLKNNHIEIYEDGHILTHELETHLAVNRSIGHLQDYLNTLKSWHSPSDQELLGIKKTFVNKLKELDIKHQNDVDGEFKARAYVIYYQFIDQLGKRFLEKGMIKQWIESLEKLCSSQTTKIMLPDIYIQSNVQLGEHLFTQAPLDTDITNEDSIESKIELAKMRSEILAKALSCINAANERAKAPLETLDQEIKRALAESKIREGQLLLIQQSNEGFASKFSTIIQTDLEMSSLANIQTSYDANLISRDVKRDRDAACEVEDSDRVRDQSPPSKVKREQGPEIYMSVKTGQTLDTNHCEKGNFLYENGCYPITKRSTQEKSANKVDNRQSKKPNRSDGPNSINEKRSISPANDTKRRRGPKK